MAKEAWGLVLRVDPFPQATGDDVAGCCRIFNIVESRDARHPL